MPCGAAVCSVMWIIVRLLWLYICESSHHLPSAATAVTYSVSELFAFQNTHIHSRIDSSPWTPASWNRRYCPRGSRRMFVHHHSDIDSLLTPPRQRPSSNKPIGSSRTITSRNQWSVSMIPSLSQNLVPTPNANFALFNASSLNSKAAFIIDHNIDFLHLTETWQQPKDDLGLNLAVPAHYQYFDKPCTNG